MARSNFIVRGGADFSGITKAVKQAQNQLQQFQNKINGIMKGVGAALGSLAVGKLVKTVAKTAIEYNSMLETARVGFETMLGSAEKAQAFLDDMADFAAKTPFEYPELLDAAKKMLAYGFAAENVLPTLRAVGDATAALGMGGEGIDRVTLALGQILAKGRLSAEEMRQLTEAGIPAWHMLAEAMGTTVPELQKMVSKGLVPGAKAVEMLTAGMEKRFGGMMASMENTWQGVTSSIKDIWRMTVGTLTQTLFGGLNSMLIQVRDFMAAFYTYLQGILGKKAKQSTDALVGSTKAQAAAITEVGDASEEAAKKANKNLQAFDEVHQLQEEMSDAAVGDIAVPGAGPVAPLELEDTGEPTAFSKFQEVLEKLAVLFDPAIEGFNRLKTAAEPVIANIGEGLRWFYDNILVPFGTWVIAEAVPSFMDLLSGALNALNPILEVFKSLGQWLWESFLQPAGEWAGETLLNALDWLANALTRIGDWMSENMGVIEAIAIVVGSFAAAWGLVNLAIGIWNVIGAIAAGVTTAFGAAVAFLTSPIFLIIAAIAAVIAIVVLLIKHWDEVEAAAIACWEWIKQTWQVVAEWFNTNVIQPVANFFVNLWEGIKNAASSVWDWVKNAWNNAGSWFSENVTKPVGNFFKNTWNSVKEGASTAWGKTKEAWKSTSTWFGENVTKPAAKLFMDGFTKILQWGVNAYKGIVKAFENLSTWFRNNVTEPIANFFKGAINTVVNGLNWLIRGLNKISITVPDWVADILGMDRGSRFGFNIPEIPKLAAGTNYVPQNMLAMLHEGEAVVPKKYNPAAGGGFDADELEQAVYRGMMSALRIAQASTQQDNRELVLKLDSTPFARVMLSALISEGQRQGLDIVLRPQGV